MAGRSSTKISLIAGLFLTILAVFTYLTAPFIIQYISKKDLMLNPESITYQNWKEPTIPIYFKVYFFNVTNAREIINNHSKPEVVQVGPYTFLESRHRVNITWNRVNGTLSYHERKRWTFIPHMTSGTLDDLIVHLNVPMISAAHEVKRRGGDEFMFSTLQAIIDNGADLFPRHTARELLFDGYYDSFIETAITLGEKPPFDKFGFFYQKNNSVPNKQYSIYTGEGGTMNKFGLMNTFNNKESLYLWNGKSCNDLRQSTPGDFRPPFPHTRPSTINLFAPEMCRSVPLSFIEQVELFDLVLDRYFLSHFALDYSEPSNLCYCKNNVSCPPNGLMDVSQCSFGSPMFLSMPHFLFADRTLIDGVTGLAPDPFDHIFYVDYEPALSIPVNVKARLQVNIFVEKVESLSLLSQMNNIYFPLIWTETEALLDDDMLNKIKLFQIIPNIIAISAFVELFLATVILISTLVQVLRLKATNNKRVEIEDRYETIILNQDVPKSSM